MRLPVSSVTNKLSKVFHPRRVINIRRGGENGVLRMQCRRHLAEFQMVWLELVWILWPRTRQPPVLMILWNALLVEKEIWRELTFVLKQIILTVKNCSSQVSYSGCVRQHGFEKGFDMAEDCYMATKKAAPILMRHANNDIVVEL